MNMDKFVTRKRKLKAVSMKDAKVKKLDSNEKHLKDECRDPKPPAETADKTKVSPMNDIAWRKIKAENLDLDYCRLYNKVDADKLFAECEQQLEYNTGQLAKVQIFGKWLEIPRKQVAVGDPGLSYAFSGNQIPARPWIPMIADVRDQISNLTGHKFNFVLINRYNDGNDYMGEHRDDEKDLDLRSPIASLSLGQSRDFYFKHCDSRGKKATRKIDLVTLKLEHGALLLMNYPTNAFWYHSLPKRKAALGVRINMTFRKMKT